MKYNPAYPGFPKVKTTLDESEYPGISNMKIE